MTRSKFKKYIISIGFICDKYMLDRFSYKNHTLIVYNDFYELYKGKVLEFNGAYVFEELKPLKQIERSYKLKKILN